MLFTQFIQTVKYSSVHIQHCILNASKLVFKGIRMRKSLNSRQKSRKSLYDTFCFLATVTAKKKKKDQCQKFMLAKKLAPYFNKF